MASPRVNKLKVIFHNHSDHMSFLKPSILAEMPTKMLAKISAETTFKLWSNL